MQVRMRSGSDSVCGRRGRVEGATAGSAGVSAGYAGRAPDRRPGLEAWVGAPRKGDCASQPGQRALVTLVGKADRCARRVGIHPFGSDSAAMQGARAAPGVAAPHGAGIRRSNSFRSDLVRGQELAPEGRSCGLQIQLTVQGPGQPGSALARSSPRRGPIGTYRPLFSPAGAGPLTLLIADLRLYVQSPVPAYGKR